MRHTPFLHTENQHANLLSHKCDFCETRETLLLLISEAGTAFS